MHDQARYEHIWEYINLDATRTAIGSSDIIGTATEDINVVTTTTTTATFPPEPSITEKTSNTSFKMQLERY